MQLRFTCLLHLPVSKPVHPLFPVTIIAVLISQDSGE